VTRQKVAGDILLSSISTPVWTRHYEVAARMWNWNSLLNFVTSSLSSFKRHLKALSTMVTIVAVAEFGDSRCFRRLSPNSATNYSHQIRPVHATIVASVDRA